MLKWIAVFLFTVVVSASAVMTLPLWYGAIDECCACSAAIHPGTCSHHDVEWDAAAHAVAAEHQAVYGGAVTGAQERRRFQRIPPPAS